jgi:hypothetical protein
MATTIKLKNGSGAPLAGDLVQGEPALDLTNKRLYTEDSGGTVIEVGTNPGTDVTFADNRKAIFGAGSDLQIYHDGSNSYIRENGTGLLYIGATDKLLIQDSTLTNTSAKFDTNADVSLYYNNDKRLETTSTGIDVTGDITVSDGTPFIRLQDSDVTNGYTQIANTNGNGYIGARNDTANGIFLVGGYGGGTFTEWARWSDAGNLTQKNNLIVQGTFTSLGIDDNATSTAITINSSGDVGIGTTDPSDGKLQISATATAGVFVKDSSGSNAAPYIRVQGQRQDGNASESFSGGLVLEQHRTDAAISNNKALGTIYFGGNHTDGSESNIAYGASIVGKAEGTFNSASDMPMGLAFFTGSTGRALGTANVDFGTERMRIDSSGNVGIGETNPSNPMHINSGATTVAQRIDTNISSTQGNVDFLQAYTTNGYASSFNLIREGTTNTGLAFKTTGSGTLTERMRIDASGNVLVGKTSTGLNTAGAEFTTDGQVFATSSNVIAGYFNRQGATGTTNLVGFRVANSDAGTIQSSAGGTPAFAAASDQRLKDNITDHESELSNVMALRPVRWDWKDETKGAGEGFVAQELEQTAWADLVSEGEDGYKMVSGLGAVETRLIKALQEAVTRIKTLEAEVAALKGA